MESGGEGGGRGGGGANRAGRRLTCPFQEVVDGSVADGCVARLDVHERFASDPHGHHLLHAKR